VNRPQQVREIFAELKQVFGVRVAAGELVRVANALLETYRSLDIEHYGDFGYPKQDPYFALDVDKAMRDGGWKVLNFEKTGMALSDDLPDNYWAVQSRVHRLVGFVDGHAS
jgi:hypothetical protein